MIGQKFQTLHTNHKVTGRPLVTEKKNFEEEKNVFHPINAHYLALTNGSSTFDSALINPAVLMIFCTDPCRGGGGVQKKPSIRFFLNIKNLLSLWSDCTNCHGGHLLKVSSIKRFLNIMGQDLSDERDLTAI